MNEKEWPLSPAGGGSAWVIGKFQRGVDKKLNRIIEAQVSNLRGEAANWQQQVMIRISKAENKKLKTKNDKLVLC